MTASRPAFVRRSRVAACLSAALALVGLPGPTPAQAGVPIGPVVAGFAGQAGYGTIKGRLVWGGAQAPQRRVLEEKGKADKDPAVCAAEASIPDNSLVVDPETKGVKYAFAYLVKPKGANADAVKAVVGKNPTVVVDQKNCEFLPYSTALHQDQTIIFKSSDPVNHNIHLTPFTNPAFNLILAANGQVEKKLVAERRVIPLTCDIHPWMKGWIMVFDHPFYAVTGADGSFEIRGVPAGDQNLVVWQEAVGFATQGLAKGMPVKVNAGDVVDLGDIKLDPAKVRGLVPVKVKAN